jgi:hypothetical protein
MRRYANLKMTPANTRGKHHRRAHRRRRRERMYNATKRIGAVVVVITTLLLLAPMATADASTRPAPQVARHGSCSRQADWKLKVAPENGRLQVEFEVEHATPSAHWQVRIKENGSRLLSIGKVVRADGSFDVKHRANNTSGPDRFVARATNASSGESCVGTVTF